MCSTHTTRLFFEIFSILPHFRSILASINSLFLNQFPLSFTPPFSPLSPFNIFFFPTFQYFIEQFPNRPLQTKFISPTFSNSLYVSIKYTFLPNSFLLYNVNFSLSRLKNPPHYHQQLPLLLSPILFSTPSKITFSNFFPPPTTITTLYWSSLHSLLFSYQINLFLLSKLLLMKIIHFSIPKIHFTPLPYQSFTKASRTVFHIKFLVKIL